MASLVPVATWGLQVGTNDDPEPAFTFGEMPATLRITMAALDPGEDWEANNGSAEYKDKKPRATLKMITIEEPDDEDDETDPSMASLLDESDESGESSDENDNGEGPSNLEKAKKVVTNGINGVIPNGIKKQDVKGKGKAVDASSDMDEDDEDHDDDDSSEGESTVNEYVLCTLDPDNHYQQTLDITIPEDEQVLFRVEGTHSVYLTGNIVIDPAASPYDDSEYDSDDEDVDLSPGEDELDYFDDEDESDALDDTADPRVMEVDSDDSDAAEAPKLVKKEITGGKKAANADKGKNKRPAPEDSDVSMTEADAKAGSIDDILAKSLKTELPATAVNGDKPLSNKQKKKLNKKLKDNAGNAVDVASSASTDAKAEVDVKSSPAGSNGSKSDKHVQFAKTLVQGPSGGATSNSEAAKASNAESTADKKKAPKASLGVKVVDGVTIDDKKLGSGRAAKKGDRVSMRYIGKLDSTKQVFDSNKKGAPFSFKLGSGQVIKGWDIGVAGMAMGGERRITVPANLAYGNKKAGDAIPPNSTLVFDLKLLEVKP